MLNGVPRILIIRLSAIGDVVRVLPALHCLRETYPNAQIDWVVEKKSAAILEGHPAIDQLLIFERTSEFKTSFKGFRETCKQIRENRYDIVMDFHGIFKSGIMTLASRAPERYGFSRPRSQEGSYLLTNKRVKLGEEIVNRMHENLALCEPLVKGVKSLDVLIHIPDDALDMAEDFMEENFHGNKKIVALHPPVERPEKQWPLENYAKLSDMLISDGRFEVLLTWGPGQLDMVREVANKTTRKQVIAPETDGLKQYMALVQSSDLYFGGDTGPMHIASALDVPVIAVFGGTKPEQHATLRQPYRILCAQYDLPDEQHFAEISSTDKMAMISPEMAYDACVELLFNSAK